MMDAADELFGANLTMSNAYVTIAHLQQLILAEASGILGIPVGDQDDFFRSGGDSLKAAKLAAKVKNVTRLDVSLGTVLNNPVLGDLAAACSALLEVNAPEEVLRTSSAVALTVNQARRLERDTWARFGGREAHHVVALYEVHGRLNLQALERAGEDVVRRHDILAYGFAMTGGAATAWPLRTFPAILESNSLQAESTFDDAKTAAATLTGRLFDLETEAKLRLSVLTWPDSKRHLLAVTVEHLCCDGESLVRLIRDLSHAYTARLAGDEPAWTSPVPSFAEWVEWEDQHYTGIGLAQRMQHWKATLDPQAPVPEVRLRDATDPSDLTNLTPQQCEILVEPAQALAFESGLRNDGHTLYTGLSAAVLLASAAFSGNPLVGICSPISSRPLEWDHAVGWFAATGVLRLRIDPAHTLDELLEATRAQLALAAENLLPIPVLLEQLTPVTARGRFWRPRVFFSVEDLCLPHLDLLGASTKAIPELGQAALRDGIALWAVRDGAGLNLAMQFARENLAADRARAVLAFIRAVVSDYPALKSMQTGAILQRLNRL
jgi:hypothetical protein